MSDLPDTLEKALSAPAPMSAANKEHMRAALHAELAVSTLSSRTLLMWVAVATWVTTTLALALFSWANTQHSSAFYRWATALLFAAVLAFGPAFLVVPGQHQTRRLLFVVTGIAALASLFAASGQAPAMPFLSGAKCLMATFGVSAIPFGVSVWALRHFSPQPFRTALAATLASTAGLVALHFHCPNGAHSHLLAFHWGALPLLVAVALLARRSFVSQSYSP